MRNRSLRGLGVAGTLVIATLIFTLALAVSGAGLFHLNLSSRVIQEAKAQDLAESAIARVVERVLQHEKSTGELNYGADLSQTIRIQHADDPEAFGLATFDPAEPEAATWNLDPCLNNLESDSATAANNGTVVPRESLYIMAIGTSGECIRRVETVVYLPRFPYSVACKGPFTGRDILVAGIKQETEVTAGLAVPEEDLQAGHLVSNSNIGNSAVNLQGDTRLKGNLRSVSGANLGPSARVDGEMLLYSTPAEIPTIDLEQYRPTTSDTYMGLLSLERNLHLDRTAYFETSGSPMVIVEGLHLEGGFLFVRGDLEIQGGVSGKGAVIATGNLSITGSAGVATDNVAAFMAGGDMILTGTGAGPEDSVIEGLVYAGGKTVVQNLTIVGVMLSAGDEESVLENSIILERPEFGTIELTGVNTETVDDPTTWEHVDFQLVDNATYSNPDYPTPEHHLAYPARGGGAVPWPSLEPALARQAKALEDRVLDDVNEQLGKLPKLKDAKGDGIEDPGWKGYLVVQPVSQVQNRVIVTSHTVNLTNTVRTTTKTLLSIDLTDFISPLDRMRVRLWRTL